MSKSSPDNDDFGEPEKAVLDEKRLVTGRISETTRYIGFGLLAFFYGMISSNEPFAQGISSEHSAWLKVMALFGLAAVLFDYLQYLFGRAAVQKALVRADKPFTYNKKWVSYRAREACFWAKQLTALLGSAILILIITFADD